MAMRGVGTPMVRTLKIVVFFQKIRSLKVYVPQYIIYKETVESELYRDSKQVQLLVIQQGEITTHHKVTYLYGIKQVSE